MDGKIYMYLVRHGETYLNRYKRMQGWADSPLTEEGKIVAVECGKKLSDIRFDRVYTSDSGRTVETAELILGQNKYSSDLPINKTKAFRESFFGSFEGEYSEVAWDKIAKQNGCANFKELLLNHSPEEAMRFTKETDPFHDAENHAEHWARLEKGLNEIIAQNRANDENVLVVTHGNTIRNLIHKFSEKTNVRVEIKNSSVSIIEYTNSVFKVISFNQ